MLVQESIEAKLSKALSPSMLKVENESHMHGGPATESHYNITAVSDEFADLSLVRRHQAVYKLLEQEMAEGVHALALHLILGSGVAGQAGIFARFAELQRR